MEWLNKSQMAVLWLRGELRSVGRGGCPAFATIATDRGASDRHGRGENTQNGGSSTTTWWGTNRLLVITVENSEFRWPLKESFGKSQNAGDGLGSPRLRKQPRQVPVGPPYGFRGSNTISWHAYDQGLEGRVHAAISHVVCVFIAFLSANRSTSQNPPTLLTFRPRNPTMQGP